MGSARATLLSLGLVLACCGPVESPRDVPSLDATLRDESTMAPDTSDVAPTLFDAPDNTLRDANLSEITDSIARDVLAQDRATPDASTTLSATNPVLGEDHPDPQVVRTTDGAGRAVYYLQATVDSGDFAQFESRDLLRWTRRAEGLFRRTTLRGNSLEINGSHFCHLWAPEVAEVRAGVWMLSFTAVRFRTPQTPCPPYREDSGVYLASASAPTGPFALASRPWEPLVAGGHATDCAASTRQQIPHALPYSAQDCQGGFCHHVIRLDSTAFRDPLTNRWWLGYSWYTNTPPQVVWEQTHYGEHVNLVELDRADPFAVRCASDVAQIPVGDPHDADLTNALRASCTRCGEMLSFTRGRDNAEYRREGYTFGVQEGVSLFRRGAMVYAMVSGSVWDSAYYHVWWAAASTPEGLASDNRGRIVGRFLIPNRGQSFGHGSAVLGPDGRSWYFVHHRLQADRCRTTGRCARDVWVSPIAFEDRGDGRGDVWIRPRFPAEDPSVRVQVP
ncbi:MAG: family 43 glycosylhydrolase [Deltaproteobacteria bacterium]|nr:family 43 glycosylhydrolase [Deltaproteobacteria bacterium]